MLAAASSNKAKIARRVIEVLEYFDDTHREATVMDIVRRYNRPQSSTSELLSSLVELGLLHKDPFSRSYSLSPRAALLGSSGQPEIVRDGRLLRLVDRLVAQTGLSVALFGMVGLKAQIVSWHSGARPGALAGSLYGGMQEPLACSAVGGLLLSTVPQPRREGMLRRLNAEAASDAKFSVPDQSARIEQTSQSGYAVGDAGFGSRAKVLAVLLPDQPHDHPLAVGFIHDGDSHVNPESLLDCLREAIAQCLASPGTPGAAPIQIEKLPTAA